MPTMEQRVRELINPLDLSCEAQRDKIVKIFIQSLKDQEKITRHTCADEILDLRSKRAAYVTWNMAINEAVQAIMNVNTEKG